MTASKEHRINVNLGLVDGYLMDTSHTSNGVDTMDTDTDQKSANETMMAGALEDDIQMEIPSR